MIKPTSQINSTAMLLAFLLDRCLRKLVHRSRDEKMILIPNSHLFQRKHRWMPSALSGTDRLDPFDPVWEPFSSPRLDRFQLSPWQRCFRKTLSKISSKASDQSIKFAIGWRKFGHLQTKGKIESHVFLSFSRNVRIYSITTGNMWCHLHIDSGTDDTGYSN